MIKVDITDHLDGTYSCVIQNGKVKNVFSQAPKRPMVLELSKLLLSKGGEYQVTITKQHGEKKVL